MNGVRPPAILVGVSGSGASRTALRWAAEEARRRHATLRIVCAWEPEFCAPYAPTADHLTAEQQRAAAGAALAVTMRAALGPVDPDGVAAEQTRGAPERILLDRSADADLLVLGSAAPPSSAARSIGPVVRACLSRAQCPVVVVAEDSQ